MPQMNESYKKELKTNSILFGIGEIFTKVLQYFVSLFLSFFLTTTETGNISIIKTAGLLIIPLITLDIIESVVNFTADGKHNHKGVFTIGMIFAVGGLALALPIALLVNSIFDVLNPLFIACYIGTLLLHNIIHYYVKGTKRIKLYVLNSVIYAIGTCAVCILCLYLFKGGIQTYFICFIATNIFCTLFMFLIGRLWRDFSFKSIKKPLLKEMIKYSLPLIINTLGWWLISATDTFVTKIFLDTSHVGILSYSHKLPTILISLFSIFGMSFQLLSFSKFDLNNNKSRVEANDVFSLVFDKVICFLGVSVLFVVLINEPIMKFFVERSYYEAWRYVPIYSLGIFFYVLSTFYGYIYNVKKNNLPLLFSTIICGLCNIGLCVGLFYLFNNLFAAAISTAISYLIVFLFRAIHSRKYIQIKLNYKHAVAFGILLISVVINSLVQLDTLYLALINASIVLIYIIIFRKGIFAVLKQVFKR